MELPKLQHSFTALISAPTGSEKSHFVGDLTKYKQDLLNHPIHKIIWWYGIFQLFYDEIEDVEFHEGFPKHSKEGFMNMLGKHTLIIIDDLMKVCSSYGKLQDLFFLIIEISVLYLLGKILFIRQNICTTLH